jgi:nitrate reductase (NAD(P)H)
VWDSWRIKIHGLVDRPLEISMEQLMALPKREIPILLVCAGNRRKEQNMVCRLVNWMGSYRLQTLLILWYNVT